MTTIEIPSNILCPKYGCGYIARMVEPVTNAMTWAKFKCDECNLAFSVKLARMETVLESE